MKRLSFPIISVLFSLCALSVSAQTTYTCDFEQDSLRSRWIMNQTANPFIQSQLENWWQLGSEGNNTIKGKYGLYISDDSVHAHYTSTKGLVLVYTKIQLDANPNGYKLSFDWKGVGNSNSEKEGLYAFWFPEKDDFGDDFKVFCSPNDIIPSDYNPYVIQLNPDLGLDYLRGSASWKQCSVDIPKAMCDGEPHYLAFGWINGIYSPVQPGACVDNINIADSRACAKPTGLTITTEGTDVTLSWNDMSNESYEVSAYAYSTRQWFGPYTTTDTSYLFPNLDPGMLDFYVRAKCDEEIYSLKATKKEFVYYPDELCIDYLDLNNNNCFVDKGFTDKSNTGTFNSFVPRVVDNGSASTTSRHTIHYDYDEVDPNTICIENGKQIGLHTVPDGALASVRLGNSEVNFVDGGAERCEFEFVVDTSEFSVLRLKYAVVIEAPNHHPWQNTRFRMDIFRKNEFGNWESLGSCTHADFNANMVYDTAQHVLVTSDTTWHQAASIDGMGVPVLWKDWTTVGVNLNRDDDFGMPLHGQTLKVQFTTCDCVFHAHFGYAYFTLECSNGQLQGMQCAQINPEFEAPDGFVYRWLLRDDEIKRDANGTPAPNTILGREQKYFAGLHDDKVYAVDCMFEQDTTCFFTLYASTLAKFPIPVMDMPQVTAYCTKEQYSVAFRSLSYVQQINHIKGDTTITNERLDSVVWDFGDGQYSYEKYPTHIYPSTGGDYTVSLHAYLMDCDSVRTITLHLPQIGPTRDTTAVYLCDADKAQGYHWLQTGKNYSEYGLYSDTLYSAATGCDSILFLDLREPWRDTIHARILDDESYLFHGMTYNKNGDYLYASPSCDTAQVLELRIYEKLRVVLPSLYYTCQGEPNFDMTYAATPEGQCEHYSLKWNGSIMPEVEETALDATIGVQSVEIDPNWIPDIYQGEVTFYDSISGNVVLPFRVMVRYPSTVIMQRWNDVLAIRNSTYNGGYTFSDYQWYHTDATGTQLDSIPGATGSYLYTESGMRPGDYYAAGVTRANDLVNLLICPVQVTDQSKYADIPTLVEHSSTLLMTGSGTSEWTTPLGISLGTFHFDNTAIPTPSTRGIHLLIIEGEQSSKSVHRVVVY